MLVFYFALSFFWGKEPEEPNEVLFQKALFLTIVPFYHCFHLFAHPLMHHCSFCNFSTATSCICIQTGNCCTSLRFSGFFIETSVDLCAGLDWDKLNRLSTSSRPSRMLNSTGSLAIDLLYFNMGMHPEVKGCSYAGPTLSYGSLLNQLPGFL